MFGSKVTSDDDGQRSGEVFREGKVAVFHPRIVQVDERVMHHVQGAGDSAQKSACFIRIRISVLPEAPKRRMRGKNTAKHTVS